MAGRRAPSLESIEAFLLALDAGSFQEAAEQIALSPSAFSRRIQTLEAFVGRSLFDRSGPTPQITAAGRAYGREIESSMANIVRATNQLRDQPAGDHLRVITSHALAVGWLMPRLGELHSSIGITINLEIGRGSARLRSGEVDLAIWGGARDAPDYASDPLVTLSGVPIASKRLADGREAPKAFKDLRAHRLLRAKNATDLWAGWLDGVGESAGSYQYSDVENTHLAYEGAASGLGVAIAVPMLADRIIAEGRVDPCFDECIAVPIGYRLIYAQDKLRRRSDVKQFKEWLRKEAETSASNFQAWAGASTRKAVKNLEVLS
ncbi:MAG: LysR family transcriptional regulator [Sphingomonas sp.]|uniref:LysR substrate-binding domain-containing protein n=1 Tax=Sphingomonas sp. TaxID=28214 RepID=UPI001AD2E927|nr:LysR substrate-binding domain-containing protein [Sphingomonas sp.]MBN8816323.1 LysR family transcriptional regulator [Sphingomonas sp.]